MMFLTLLPKLLDQAAHVGLLLSARLVPIYQRSCQDWIDKGRVSVWSHKAAASGKLSSNDFHYQSPVGSVCQYIANRIEEFSPKVPILISDHGRAAAFRNSSSMSDQRPMRIGISWRGGGRSDRIKLKSVSVDMIAELMREHMDKASFVNLQYGDMSSVVGNWRSQGLPVVNEPTVNPLKDMEIWLDLVASVMLL